MKITRKEKDNTINFMSLGCGAIFTPAEGDDKDLIFLRIEAISNEVEEYNAVFIENGECVYFTPTTPVIKISAEMIVEY